jgi:H+-transporting ATPase
VTATGIHTKFGRTAELVRTAHVASSQQKAVLRIVRNLAIFNAAVIVLIGIYAYLHSMPWSEMIPLLLTSVLAAIPVALPATFTLAAALGARALAKLGVLPTRLTAVDEAATIDVLCADKTGTLTLNALSVTRRTFLAWPRWPAPRAERTRSIRPFATRPRTSLHPTCQSSPTSSPSIQPRRSPKP